jgi:hypothetical protein
VQYIFNKDVFLFDTLPVLAHSLRGTPSTTFDEYSNWNDLYIFGKDSIMETYTRPEREPMVPFTQTDASTVRGNIEQNYVRFARENPNVDFYVFMAPYSIMYWDTWNQQGQLLRNLEAQKLVIEILLEQENIYLFSFFDDFDLVTDLDRYKDRLHYDEAVNSQLLVAMAQGEHLLTKENYEAYLASVEQFYTTYPYEDLFS